MYLNIKSNLKYFLTLMFLYLPEKCLALGPLNGDVLDDVTNQDLAIANQAGFVTTFKMGDAVNLFIKGFLGLLGLIFIILVMVAGFNWMTAGGDETKVAKSKSTIQRAILGLIVIIAAYTITAFVFKALDGVVQ